MIAVFIGVLYARQYLQHRAKLKRENPSVPVSPVPLLPNAQSTDRVKTPDPEAWASPDEHAAAQNRSHHQWMSPPRGSINSCTAEGGAKALFASPNDDTQEQTVGRPSMMAMIRQSLLQKQRSSTSKHSNEKTEEKNNINSIQNGQDDDDDNNSDDIYSSISGISDELNDSQNGGVGGDARQSLFTIGGGDDSASLSAYIGRPSESVTTEYLWERRRKINSSMVNDAESINISLCFEEESNGNSAALQSLTDSQWEGKAEEVNNSRVAHTFNVSSNDSNDDNTSFKSAESGQDDSNRSSTSSSHFVQLAENDSTRSRKSIASIESGQASVLDSFVSAITLPPSVRTHHPHVGVSVSRPSDLSKQLMSSSSDNDSLASATALPPSPRDSYSI